MKIRDVVLNGTLAVLTVGAVAAVTVRLRSRPVVRASLQVVVDTVPNWRTYAVGSSRFGRESSPVVITVFSDFGCHFCREFAAAMDTVRQRHPDQVAVVYRHVPITAYGVNAGRAAVCGARQGKFEAMARVLSAQAESVGVFDSIISGGDWAPQGRAAGVPDLRAFVTCARGRGPTVEISQDVADSRRLGVHAVPTILVNQFELVRNVGARSLDSVVGIVLRGAAAN